jgi:hypothetical protein
VATKRINENPTIADQVILELETPDADGCFKADPYMIDTVTIYYVERSYNGSNYGVLVESTQNATLKDELIAAQLEACDSPTEENLANVTFLQNELELSAKNDISYFSKAEPVKIYGDSDNPAWLSGGNEVDYEVKQVLTEAEVIDTGKFEVIWNPLGMRSGNYLVYWTWTPYVGSQNDKLTQHFEFTLEGATQLTTSIPTHFTDPLKYETLLERYLPDMFKLTLSDPDLTPYVLEEFNQAVAKGFTFMEDLANQTVDLIDANATHEHFLPLLGGLFRLSLRSQDPTLWRRQIKRAIPLFKRKGTLLGLQEALAQANVSLTKYTRLWQVISKYTYQELFDVATDYQTEFTLSQTAILPTDTNFELYYREPAPIDDTEDTTEWQALTLSDYATLANTDDITTLTFIGAGAPTPIYLMEGASIRIIYKIVEIPTSPPDEQTIETHVRTLALSDSRDERTQDYPPKNWNVRLLEDDDVLFDRIILEKNPYYDPLVYGHIRTEFPYSENVYNMEEYNGSKRESLSPCDIDKEFLDPCSDGISSKFDVELEIDDLSNDRVIEAQEIIEEFKPFHAVLNTVNLMGYRNDFVEPPTEQILALVDYDVTEVTLVNPAQTIFNRFFLEGNPIAAMEDTSIDWKTVENWIIVKYYGGASEEFWTGSAWSASSSAALIMSTTDMQVEVRDMDDEDVAGVYDYGEGDAFIWKPELGNVPSDVFDDFKRDALATATVVGDSTAHGQATASNLNIELYAPNVSVNAFMPHVPSIFSRLRILSPSLNAGDYEIDDITLHGAIITGTLPPEPLDTAAFTFEMSYEALRQATAATIDPSDIFYFSDVDVDFIALNVKSQADVDAGFATNPFTIYIPSLGGDYDILQIMPDGSFVLLDELSFPLPASGATELDYTLRDETGSDVITVTDEGTITAYRRGKVTLSGTDNVNVIGTNYMGSTIGNLSNFIKRGYYAEYSGTEYSIIEFVANQPLQFYIDGYTGASVGGATIVVYNKVIINETGYLHYKNMQLDMHYDYEANPGVGLEPIQNGENPPAEPLDASYFKENYLVMIGDDVNDSRNYYVITDIDGDIVTINGEPQNWPTTGTAIDYSFVHFEKQAFDVPERINPYVPGYHFNSVDRRGQEIITYEVNTSTPVSLLAVAYALNAGNKNTMVDMTKQQESISFSIEWLDK